MPTNVIIAIVIGWFLAFVGWICVIAQYREIGDLKEQLKNARKDGYDDAVRMIKLATHELKRKA